MDTYFAPPERASEEELAAEISFVSRNPVMTGLLHSISGLIAILNVQRQVISINDAFLRMLGVDDPSRMLGLRPGEVVQCIHAHDEPAGCGTTKFCSTCGAAIAIVTSLGEDKPAKRICALTSKRGDRTVDITLLVRTQPIRLENRRFLLLFLQDITQQQQMAALERVFFHDVNNMLNMLVGASELLVETSPSELAGTVHKASLRLYNEVAIQRCLSQNESGIYLPMWQEITTEEILEELRAFFASHPVAQDKRLEFEKKGPTVSFKTDISLILRVLCNMITNALEASEKDGVVKIWVEHENESVSFCVWNLGEIPRDVCERIFQRNFSTKEQAGRGVGTYSIKLFGEDILGGQVGFTTSGEEGTIFRFTTHV